MKKNNTEIELFKNSWEEYSKNLLNTFNGFNETENILKVALMIWDSFDGKNEVHIIGNGGSAANAHHIVGDFSKTFCLYKQNLRISSIGDNGCYLTAAANDLDFSEIFSFLIPHRIKEQDHIIFLSGSGNSSNLVKCALKAKEYGINTASITGYDGGKLSEICKTSVNFKINDMEIAEDMQIITFHNIKQYLCSKLLKEKQVIPIEVPKYEKRISNNEVT